MQQTQPNRYRFMPLTVMLTVAIAALVGMVHAQQSPAEAEPLIGLDLSTQMDRGAGRGGNQPRPVPAPGPRPNPGPPQPQPPGLSDTIIVSSSSPEILEARLTETEEGSTSEPVELLRTSFDRPARSRTDLVIRVDGECAALIDLPISVANTSTGARSVAVTTWVELDGVPVSVGGNTGNEDDFADDGELKFCQSSETADLAELEADEIIAKFEESSSTGGFTWAVPEVSRGFHELVVKARLDVARGMESQEQDEGNGSEPPQPPDEENGGADVLGFVGKRALIVGFEKATFEEPDE